MRIFDLYITLFSQRGKPQSYLRVYIYRCRYEFIYICHWHKCLVFNWYLTTLVNKEEQGKFVTQYLGSKSLGLSVGEVFQSFVLDCLAGKGKNINAPSLPISSSRASSSRALGHSLSDDDDRNEDGFRWWWKNGWKGWTWVEMGWWHLTFSWWNAVGLMHELFFSGEMIVDMMGEIENGGWWIDGWKMDERTMPHAPSTTIYHVSFLYCTDYCPSWDVDLLTSQVVMWQCRIPMSKIQWKSWSIDLTHEFCGCGYHQAYIFSRHRQVDKLKLTLASLQEQGSHEKAQMEDSRVYGMLSTASVSRTTETMCKTLRKYWDSGYQV